MKLKHTYNMTEYMIIIDKYRVGITRGISTAKFDLKLNKWTNYHVYYNCISDRIKSMPSVIK